MGSNNTLLEIVIDLPLQFVLEFLLKLIGIGYTQVIIDKSLLVEKTAVLLEQFFHTFIDAANLVPMNRGTRL